MTPTARASAARPRAARPSMLTWRRSRPTAPSAVNPVTTSVGPDGVRSRAPTDQADTASPPRRSISVSRARRNPRPGVSSDSASSTLVLPLPLAPTSTTNSGPRTRRSERWQRKFPSANRVTATRPRTGAASDRTWKVVSSVDDSEPPRARVRLKRASASRHRWRCDRRARAERWANRHPPATVGRCRRRSARRCRADNGN